MYVILFCYKINHNFYILKDTTIETNKVPGNVTKYSTKCTILSGDIIVLFVVYNEIYVVFYFPTSGKDKKFTHYYFINLLFTL